MKFLKPLLLGLVVTEAMTVSGLDSKAQLFRATHKELFQTTAWLDPTKMLPDPNTVASPIADSSGAPSSLQYLSPNGGSLSKTLQTSLGYEIKMILLCSYQNRPLKGVSVRLHQNHSVGSAITLPFRRMSNAAPGCAIYSLASGADDWGWPGKALDSMAYNKLEIVLPPSNFSGEIEAVGIRLQSTQCHPSQESSAGRQIHAFPVAYGGSTNNGEDNDGRMRETCGADFTLTDLDDVSDVFFSQIVQDSNLQTDDGEGGVPGNGH